jgi:hypothetical protein
VQCHLHAKNQRDQSAQRAIIPKLPVHQEEPLVISESPRTSRQNSPRTPRLKSPLAQADSLQKEHLHVMPTHKVFSNNSPLALEYGPSGFMVRAEPARLVLNARQSLRGPEGRDNSKSQTLLQGTQQPRTAPSSPCSLRRLQSSRGLAGGVLRASADNGPCGVCRGRSRFRKNVRGLC